MRNGKRLVEQLWDLCHNGLEAVIVAQFVRFLCRGCVDMRRRVRENHQTGYQRA